MYSAEVTLHRGTDREAGWDKDCQTLDDAVAFIRSIGTGFKGVKCSINGVELSMCGAEVTTGDGEPVCTNEKWHESVAPEHLKILPKTNGDDAIRPLQSYMRGTVPTNPATAPQVEMIEADFTQIFGERK